MRIATFNHMFGCNGRSLKEFLHVHALYKLMRHESIHKRSNIQKTLDVVRQADAEILGITEVLGVMQRDALVEGLKQMGYTHFHGSAGHDEGTCKDACQGTLIATRSQSELSFSPTLGLPHRFDLGGGLLGVYVPKTDVHVVYVHLPMVFFQRHSILNLHVESISKQIATIQQKDPRAKIILMGDFNCNHNYLLRHFPQHSQFTILSSSAPTCSTTQIVRWFFQHNIDRILGINIIAKMAGLIEGHSDHKLVWADVTF